jgi:hypothetical protein
VRQSHLLRLRHLAPTDQAHIQDRVMGGATGCVVTKAVQAPGRPATWRLCMPRGQARASHHALADCTRIAKIAS